MPLNVVEVAIYALVLTTAHPKPFECVAVQPDGVNCTNGLAALPGKDGAIVYNNGIKVLKDRSGRVTLSNGTTTFFDSSAWVTFLDPAGKTVVSARRTARARYSFSNGFTCEALPDPGMARCYRS
jgi:hypothetical protein